MHYRLPMSALVAIFAVGALYGVPEYVDARPGKPVYARWSVADARSCPMAVETLCGGHPSGFL